MSGLISWLNSLGDGFVLFTIRMLIQSSVLILILLLLDFVLRRRVRAVVRYWIWLLVLAKLLLPPSLSSPTSLVSWIGGRLPEATIVSFVPAPATEVREAVPRATPALMEMTPPPEANHDSFPPVPERILAPSMPSAAPAQPVVLPTWRALVLLVWVAAVVIMVVLLIQRVFFVRALLAQSQEAPGALGDLLEQCRRQMGVRGVAGIRLTSLSASPSVCGLLRPVILMPEPMARQLETPQLRSVLLHELAHVQRGDLWVNLLQTLLQIVYLYHPLLWLANARIRAIREQAVDEAVLAALGEDAEEYPRTLLSISKLAFGTPSLSLRLLGVVESKRALTARIRHMVSRPFPKNARLGLLGLAAIAVTAAVLLPMARGTQTRMQEPSPGQPPDSSTVASAGGVTVEFLGVRAYSEADKSWWRVDGTPVTGTNFPEFKEFRTPLPTLNDPNARVRVLTLRLSAPSLDDVTVRWSLRNSEGGDSTPYFPMYTVQQADEKPVLRPVQTIVARFVDNATSTDLKFGIAAGPWKDAATASEGRTTAYARDNITQNDVIYHPAQETDRSLIITATHLLSRDYDCRIVAEDENHRVFEPVRTNNSSGKCLSVLKVPRAQVKWFRLQARPYTWVEFKNIHLMPKSPEAASPGDSPSRQSRTSAASADSQPATSSSTAGSAGGVIAGVVVDSRGTERGQRGTSNLMDRLQKEEDPELAELIRVAVANHKGASEQAVQELTRRITLGRAQVLLLDQRIEEVARQIESTPGPDETRRPLLQTKKELEVKRMAEMADLREAMGILPRLPFDKQPTASLHAWVSLQVLEQQVVVLDTLKEFTDYWGTARHKVVGVLSEKETLAYLQGRLKDKRSLPIRISISYVPETGGAAEDLRQEILAAVREANADMDTEVPLELATWVGAGTAPFFLREGRITTLYPDPVQRPDGGPKLLNSGVLDPNDLEQHILWRLTMPRNLPLAFRIEYDEASSKLAAQVADTIKAVAKRVGLADVVSVVVAQVEPAPETVFLGRWQAITQGEMQTIDIQPGGTCQVTMGNGTQAIKAGANVAGSWFVTTRGVFMDIHDKIEGRSVYLYEGCVNADGNLVVNRGQVYPRGVFVLAGPSVSVFQKVK